MRKLPRGNALASRLAMTLQTRTMLLLASLLLAVGMTRGAGYARAQTTAPAPPPPEKSAYQQIAVTDPDVQAAVKVAIANYQRKNHDSVKLLSIVSAERQPVSSRNLRVCLSMDRTGNTQLARVVLSRNPRKEWSVTIWSWGSCGR